MLVSREARRAGAPQAGAGAGDASPGHRGAIKAKDKFIDAVHEKVTERESAMVREVKYNEQYV